MLFNIMQGHSQKERLILCLPLPNTTFYLFSSEEILLMSAQLNKVPDLTSETLMYSMH